MSHRTHNAESRPETPASTSYEPPRVEQALTPAELQREIMYTGGPIASEDSVDE